MHAQHNLEKYLKQLQEDTSKKHPDISNECEELLNDINNNNEIPKDCLVFEKKYFKPFISILKVKYKPDAYVYETIYYYIANNFIEEDFVKLLITLLIKHYNEHKEHGIRIMQSFYPLLRYDCVYDEILYNVFYCFICEVKSTNNVIQKSARAMCNQIVSNIFARICKTNESLYYEDCRFILNDILEYMLEKNTKAMLNNVSCVNMSLDFVECCINNKSIFKNKELWEIAYKIFDRMLEIKKEGKEVEKINKILAKIYKESIFIDFSIRNISKNEEVVILYESDIYEICLTNHMYRKEVLNTVEKYVTNKGIKKDSKLKVFKTIQEFISNKKCDVTNILFSEQNISSVNDNPDVKDNDEKYNESSTNDSVEVTENNEICKVINTSVEAIENSEICDNNTNNNVEIIENSEICNVSANNSNVILENNEAQNMKHSTKLNFYDIQSTKNRAIENLTNGEIENNENVTNITNISITGSINCSIQESTYIQNLKHIINFLIVHFYDYITNSTIEDYETTKKIIEFILPFIVKHKNILYKYFSFCVQINAEFINICIKLCVEYVSEIEDEWFFMFQYIQSRNDENLYYVLDESLKFCGDDLLKLFLGVKDVDIMYMLYTKNLERMYYNMSCVIVTLNCIYTDTQILSTFITEYYKNIKESDECIEMLPFLYMYGKLSKSTTQQMLKKYNLKCVNEYYNIKQRIRMTKDRSNYTTNKIDNTRMIENIEISNTSLREDVSQSIESSDNNVHTNNINKDDTNVMLATLLSILRTTGDKLQYSWNVILQIIELNIYDCIEINLQILQIIIEDYYSVLTNENQVYAIKLLAKLNKKNEDVNVTLQIINILNEVKNVQNSIVNWKVFVSCVLSIIKKEKTNWHNIFESGILLIFCADKHKNENGENNSDNTNIKISEKSLYFYENILPEILALTKDIFYNKLLNENITYEEKKKNKETFLIVLRRMSVYIKNDCNRSVIYNNMDDICNNNVNYTNDSDKGNSKNNSNIILNDMNDSTCVDYSTYKTIIISFMQDYYTFIKNLMCYNYNLHERGYKTWKDEIFSECVFCLNLVYIDYFCEIYLSILENVIDKCGNDENNNTYHNDTNNTSYNDTNILYSTNVCVEVLNVSLLIDFTETNFDRFLQLIFRFNKNEEIRSVIFDILNKSKYKNKVIKKYCEMLLMNDDDDMKVRILKSIYDLFLSSTIVKSIVNETKCDSIGEDSIKCGDTKCDDNICDNIKCINTNNKRQNTNNQTRLYLYVTKNEIENLFNALIANNNENYYEQIIKCVIIIGKRIKNDFELVNEYIKVCHRILKEKNNKNTRITDSCNAYVNQNLITFYGCIEDRKRDNTMYARKKEKLYILLIQEYINVVSLYFCVEDNKKEYKNNVMNVDKVSVNDNIKNSDNTDNEKKVGGIIEYKHTSEIVSEGTELKNSQRKYNFYKNVFGIIFENSFVHVNEENENLAYECLKILFKYSNIVHSGLVKRIRISLTEYVKEVSVFRELYSRTKRNEIYFIFDKLVQNRCLILDLKSEIVECLESKDFYVIEKVKECLLTIIKEM